MTRYVDLSKMPQLETWGCCCDGENYAFVPVADVIKALRQAEAQTGEVKLVVHGHWVEYQVPPIICCSNCDWATGIEEKNFQYCPNCGAKMDGGSD